MKPKKPCQHIICFSYQDFVPDDRSPSQQAGYQIAAIAVAVGIALVGGALIGLLLRLPIWDNLQDNELYEDEVFWMVRMLLH